MCARVSFWTSPSVESFSKPFTFITVCFSKPQREDKSKRMTHEENLTPRWAGCNPPFPSTVRVSLDPLWHGWPFQVLCCTRSALCQAEKATPCQRNQATALPAHHLRQPALHNNQHYFGVLDNALPLNEWSKFKYEFCISTPQNMRIISTDGLPYTQSNPS